jgi:hypothetical protein
MDGPLPPKNKFSCWTRRLLDGEEECQGDVDDWTLVVVVKAQQRCTELMEVWATTAAANNRCVASSAYGNNSAPPQVAFIVPLQLYNKIY